MDEVARAHRGHCLAPLEDGPLLVAFESAQDGLDAARHLAGRFDARVAAATGEAEPRAGTLPGRRVASETARLLKLAGPGQVVVDAGIAEAMAIGFPRRSASRS